MASFAWKTIADEEDYADTVFEIIKDVEAFGRVGYPGEAYMDSASTPHPSIGFGFNLDETPKRDAVIIKLFYPNNDRTTLLAEDEDYADDIAAALANSTNRASDSAMRAALDAIMAARHDDTSVVYANKREQFKFSAEEEAKDIFVEFLAPGFESIVDTWLADIPNSSERASLFSLAYNAPSLLGSGLKAAIIAGNRAEAWYQIRYVSNSGSTSESPPDDAGGIAKRRYYESNVFGLYNPGTLDSTEALQILKMVTDHWYDRIKLYEQRYGELATNPGDNRVLAAESDYDTSVDSLTEALFTAKSFIAATYAPYATIDRVWVGGDGADDLDFSEETDNGLFLGGSGADTLAAGSGDDHLHGQDAADTLIASTGTDTLNGGDGKDIADYSSLQAEGIHAYLSDDSKTVEKGELVAGHGAEGTDTLISIEKIIGTQHGDLFDIQLTTPYADVETHFGPSSRPTLAGGLGFDTYILRAPSLSVSDTAFVTIQDNNGGAIEVTSATSGDIIVAGYGVEVGGQDYVVLNFTTFNGVSSTSRSTILSILKGDLGGSAISTVTIDGVVFDAGKLGSYFSSLNYGEGGVYKTVAELQGLIGFMQSGTESADTLEGGSAGDTLAGGLANDTYIVNHADDVIIEASGEGTDVALSSVSHTLEANVENLTLTGSGNINGTGNNLVNILTGNSGNNTLDGGSGADTLIGGTGNDSYVVDNIGDVLIESSGEGTDTVFSSVPWTLDANFEGLTLTGYGNINATGTSASNILRGNSGNNTLDGGTGADTMIGGSGDDFYLVDNAGDVVSENVGDGIDTVQIGSSYSLGANVENLVLTGSANVYGNGNSLGNILTGNSGNNTLDGSAGVDTLIGGLGNDLYKVDDINDVIVESAAQGTDVVEATSSYTLGSHVENLTLMGIANINGAGNEQNNYLLGNTGANTLSGYAGNDTLNGSGGGGPDGNADTLIGGTGDDTYFVLEAGDVVIEDSNEGTDTVYTVFVGSYTLGSNLENLFVSGSGTGNSLDNIIAGNNGSDILSGLGGNDTLDAGTLGTDSLIGGMGNDTYIVRHGAVTVVESASEGTDTVLADVTYTLTSNVERLTLTGFGSNNGTGNSLANVITGNDSANILSGGDGDDTLDGAGGADSMIGGLGNDLFIVDDAGDTVTEATSGGTDLVQSSQSFTLGLNIENLTLTGSFSINGTGNSLNNILTGNSGSNSLDGDTGTDTMIGGLGDDTYVINVVADVVSEASGEGSDTVIANVTGYTLASNVENLVLGGTVAAGTGNSLANILTGNSSANTLTGGDGNDTLNGLAGADRLLGGSGDDVYVVDNVSDTVTENASEGIDVVQSSVTFTISNVNVENLTLTGSGTINGTGNSGVNIITGNSGNNTLDGGSGADTLIGGAGDDVYVVDNANDVVSENSSEGVDLVRASVTYTLGSNIEDLTLTGTTVNGTGNNLGNVITGSSSVNTLSGLDGNDTLDGGAGADTLIGGAGDDTYFVDNAGDIVSENVAEGTDTVSSPVTFSLASLSNIEHLTLTGSSVINATGNDLDNILTGNAVKNILSGGGGNDTIIAGGGADTMLGGTGDDLYIVSVTSSVISESAGEGIDSIQSSVTYTLSANVENLTLTAATAINGTGNGSANILIGGTGNNSLSGGAGNDTLDGGTGLDTLTGGADADIFVFDNVSNIDVVTDFSTAQGDALDIRDLLTGYTPGTHAITDWVRITDVSGNSKIEVDRDGTGGTYGWVQIATLNGVTGLTDEAALVTSGNLLAA
jgi:Ca2+-binding RTX toxin-like protein